MPEEKDEKDVDLDDVTGPDEDELDLDDPDFAGDEDDVEDGV